MSFLSRNTRLQEQALQRFAIAASEHEEARRKMNVAAMEMDASKREAERHGLVKLPVTAVLLTGEHVLIQPDPEYSEIYRYVISAPLFHED